MTASERIREARTARNYTTPACPCGDERCGWTGPAEELAEHIEWMNYVTPPNPVRYAPQP